MAAACHAFAHYPPVPPIDSNTCSLTLKKILATWLAWAAPKS